MSAVVIAGGGTGGHLFPGLAIAAELRAAGIDLSWLGAARGIEAERVPAAGIPLRVLPVTGAVGRARGAQVAAALRVLPAVAIAARHLLRHDARAVLAVGGYAAFPGALAAAALGIPVVIQEQNALPGLSNRLLAHFADAIACGFAAAVDRFPSLPARFTGNPVRREFYAVPATPPDPASLLVIGGSQGSAFLNRVVPEALALLARDGLRPRTVLQAGPRWHREVRQQVAGLGLDVEVTGFIEDPAGALATASLVIARAGALTVCELAAARRAALLVPFAAAAHDHQSYNARALAATGAAEVLAERAATPTALAAAIAGLLADPAALAARGAAGAPLAPAGAAAAVARLVLQRAAVTAAEHEPTGHDAASTRVGLGHDPQPTSHVSEAAR